MISTEQRQFESWVLTGEGEEVVEKGSHEARLFKAVAPETGSLQADIMVNYLPLFHTLISPSHTDPIYRVVFPMLRLDLARQCLLGGYV